MIRLMTIDDYESVYDLWMSIEGFGIRSIDDSREGVERFLWRNPTTSCVAEIDGEIVGAILCGHDGRSACFYHVCVKKEYRRHEIGRKMVDFCIDALRKEHINKVFLNAFLANEVGNTFWQECGWTLRDDFNTYDYVINDENKIRFNSMCF